MQDVGILLAIDTSGATASVAVYHDQVLAEATWQSGRGHSSQLLPTIEAMLNLARVDRRELSAIAVATGPGSYAGLRVGVSTAMGLSLALGIGVAQVPTLEVIAWGHSALASEMPKPIRAAIEVGRGRFATALFRPTALPEEKVGIENVGLAELIGMAAEEQAVLAVDLDRQTRGQVERDWDGRIALVPASATARRAGYLAELAAQRIRRGDAIGTTVEPIYLH